MTRIDTSGADRKFRTVRKQVRFATVKALTQVAAEARKVETAVLPRVFDQPVRFTQNAITIQPATKARPYSVVLIKDRQADYLRWQIEGGVRTPQPGAPVNVPVKLRVNRAGNIPRGKLAKLRARPDVFVASRNDPATRHMRPGLYQRYKRKGRAPKLLVAFEPSAAYRPIYPYKRRVVRTVLRRYARVFNRALHQALASTR